MEKPEDFGIYIPSYNRADTISTHLLLEYYKVVVRESQLEDYAKRVPRENIIAVEDSKINSMQKVWNWVIDNAPETIISLIGDDIPNFIYRLDYNVKITDPELITSEIERIAQLMMDLDIGWGCDDASPAPWNYNAEFTFAGTSGGINWCKRDKYVSRYSEEVGYCCDTDVVLTELLVNRVVLKPKYLCVGGSPDVNKGGNSKKSRASMVASFEYMKKKWGKYFDYQLDSNKIYVRVKRT